MQTTNSAKHFAVFDVDGTIFRSGLYREVVHELLSMGAVSTELRSAFQDDEIAWKKRQHVEAFARYEVSMAEMFNKLLPNIRCEDFDKASQQVFERVSDHVYVYTRDLIAKLKQENYTLIAISGSQTEIVEPFAKKYGFDIWVGQEYERGENGYFTGVVTLETHTNKDLILRKIVDEHGLSFEKSIAIGDSKGDISMLSIVEQPIAFNPDRKLFTTAKERKWPIVVERKNMIYKLEPHDNTFILV